MRLVYLTASSNGTCEFGSRRARPHTHQADLSREGHMARAFDLEDGAKFDYVFNFAAETKHGQSADVYQQKIVDVATVCGTAAKAAGVTRFVQVSTAGVYKSQAKKPAAEDAPLDPWTTQATYMLKAEEALQAITGLNLVIARPAYVYGSADASGQVITRCVCAAVYRYIDEKMVFLWDKNLSLNTVHVDDVCAALWHLRAAGASGDVYNLADKSHTDQGSLNVVLGRLFDIKTGFQGKMLSNVARMKMDYATQVANDKHVGPWVELIRAHGIRNTPVSPFMDKELLYQNHLYVDGSAIEKTGFTYAHPTLDEATIEATVREYVAQKLFPPVLPGMAEAEAKGAEDGSGAGAGAGSGGAAAGAGAS